MSRAGNRLHLSALYATVVDEPGITPGRLARRLRTDVTGINRLLTQAERAGLLLTEGEGNRLYPFNPGKNGARL